MQQRKPTMSRFTNWFVDLYKRYKPIMGNKIREKYTLKGKVDKYNKNKQKIFAKDLLKRPEINYEILKKLNGFTFDENLKKCVFEQVEIQIKYEGYIKQQQLEIERQFHGLDDSRERDDPRDELPEGFLRQPRRGSAQRRVAHATMHGLRRG